MAVPGVDGDLSGIPPFGAGDRRNGAERHGGSDPGPRVRYLGEEEVCGYRDNGEGRDAVVRHSRAARIGRDNGRAGVGG